MAPISSPRSCPSTTAVTSPAPRLAIRCRKRSRGRTIDALVARTAPRTPSASPTAASATSNSEARARRRRQLLRPRRRQCETLVVGADDQGVEPLHVGVQAHQRRRGFGHLAGDAERDDWIEAGLELTQALQHLPDRRRGVWQPALRQLQPSLTFGEADVDAVGRACGGRGVRLGHDDGCGVIQHLVDGPAHPGERDPGGTLDLRHLRVGALDATELTRTIERQRQAEHPNQCDQDANLDRDPEIVRVHPQRPIPCQGRMLVVRG